MKTEKTEKRCFIVYADYGGAWGWLRDNEGTARCDEFIDDVVDARNDIWLNTNIEKSLIEEFYTWQSNFEWKSYENLNFDWETFNKKGEELTEKLKQQIGHLFDDVIYEIPFECIQNNDEKEKTPKLQIEYYDAEAGWINIRLKAGDKIYEERISHVFDPLPDLKCWLEAIVIGVEQTSFTFDNEGNVIKFDAQCKWINREKKYLFTIIWEDENKVEFQVLVDKKQMIDAFYSSLINFYKSDKYNPREWEFHRTHNKLCSLLNLDYSQLIDYCAKLSKQELIELLKGIEANEAVWWVEDDYPTDYDEKSFEDKREDMKALLENNANPYDGMSLSDFRSKIIENYLNEK